MYILALVERGLGELKIICGHTEVTTPLESPKPLDIQGVSELGTSLPLDAEKPALNFIV